MARLTSTLRVAAIVLLAALAFVAGGLLEKRAALKGGGTGGRPAASKPAAEAEPAADLESLPPGTIQVGPERRQMIGLRSGPVTRESAVQNLRLLGKVAADETRSFIINSTTDGWILKVSPVSTGSFVRKGEVLATFYSAEFLPAIQSLLYALGSLDRSRPLAVEPPFPKEQTAQVEINLQQYKDALKSLGMGDAQLADIVATRQWARSIDIASPADGFVLARNVSDGLRFQRGTELFRIADLSRVWILANVFETEARFFKPGTRASILPPYESRAYEAVVSDVLPVFDPATRTLKVRLETANPGFALRPEMFVDIELPVRLPPAIVVPADAILFAGLRKVVFVDRGQGIFEPRSVETGWRLGDRVEVTAGLEEGERIVLAGNFFLDSESRLQAAGQGILGPIRADPVTGTAVDELRAAASGLTSVFDGRTYYFSSAESKARFDKDPRAYAVKAPKAEGPVR